jgi:hypothetical protein
VNSATMQLIIALLPAAEDIVFNIGGQLVKIATSDLNTPEAVAKALEDAKSEGFPQLTFVPAIATVTPAVETPAPAAEPAIQSLVEGALDTGVQALGPEDAAGAAEVPQ